MNLVEKTINMSVAKDAHEEAICLSVLSLWNRRSGQSVTILERPEKKERNSEAVDFLVGKEHPQMAVEHTRIESYANQIEDGHLFVGLLQPLELKLKDTLPRPGSYQLTIWCGTAAWSRGKKKDNIRRAIEEWVRVTAPTLKMNKPPHHYKTERLEGVPFDVTLSKFEAMSEVRNGELLISMFSPKDLEEQRATRVDRALGDKCPKLLKAKVGDMQSMLILESDDIVLANAHAIGRAFIEKAHGRLDMPDFVYLVETELSSPILWILKEQNQWYPDIGSPGHFQTEMTHRYRTTFAGRGSHPPKNGGFEMTE